MITGTRLDSDAFNNAMSESNSRETTGLWKEIELAIAMCVFVI